MKIFKTSIPFVQNRSLFYMFSGLLLTISIISIATRGLNMGIDFAGGY